MKARGYVTRKMRQAKHASRDFTLRAWMYGHFEDFISRVLRISINIKGRAKIYLERE